MHAALSLVLMVLALPPFGTPWVGLFALVPWILSLRGHYGVAVWNSTLFGVGLGLYAFIGGLWQGYLAPSLLAVLLVTAVHVLFGLIGAWLWRRRTWIVPLVAGMCWILLLRCAQWVGLPFTYGLALPADTPMLGWATLGGVALVDGLLIGGQWLLARGIAGLLPSRRRGAVAGLAVSVIVYVVVVFSGNGIPALWPVTNHGAMRLALVQPQRQPDGSTTRVADGVLTDIEAMHARLLAQLRDQQPDQDTLVVWPESAVPGFGPTFDTKLWRQIVEQSWPTLVQAYTLNKAGRRSTLFGVPRKEARPRSAVAKRRPVPFSEDGVVAANGSPELHDLAGHAIGGLICYEITRPVLARQNVAAGAELLVNVTSDADIGPSAIPWLTAGFARLRALALGTPVVRVGNGGPSGVYDIDGRRIAGLPLFAERVKTMSMDLRQRATGYMRAGWWWSLTYSMLAIIGLAIVRCRSPRTQPVPGRLEKSEFFPHAFGLVMIVAVVIQGSDLQMRIAGGMLSAGTGADKTAVGQHGLRIPRASEAADADRYALTILLRQLGEPIDPPAVPGQPQQQQELLQRHGIELRSAEDSPGRQSAAVAFALLDYPGRKAKAARLRKNGESVLYLPRTGDFHVITPALKRWFRDHDVSWLVTLGDGDDRPGDPNP